MATTLSATLKATFAGTLQNIGDLSTGEDRFSWSLRQIFAASGGDVVADQFWSDSRDAANTTDSLDLAGALTNKFGESITLTKVKLIIIKAGTTNTVDIEVTMPADGIPIFKTAADAVLLKPGGLFVYLAPAAAGIAVGAGATDQLDLTAAAGTALYDILIAGVE